MQVRKTKSSEVIIYGNTTNVEYWWTATETKPNLKIKISEFSLNIIFLSSLYIHTVGVLCMCPRTFLFDYLFKSSDCTRCHNKLRNVIICLRDVNESTESPWFFQI